MQRTSSCMWVRAAFTAALLISINCSAAAATSVVKLLCSGRNDNAPVYVREAANGTLSRMEVAVSKNGSYIASYVEVSNSELLAECANGTSVAALPATEVEGLKSGVPSQTTFPSSFTIQTSTTISCKYGQPPPTCRRDVWGNFWIPNSMPSSDNAHIVQYDLAQSGFISATLGTHFVNSLLTVSNSSFVTEFQGKGMINGVANECGGAYSAVVQTWQNNGSINSPGPSSNISGVFGSSASINTCYTLSGASNYRFLVGANRDQASVFWAYPNGASPPAVSPPVTVGDQFFWSSQAWSTGTNTGISNPYSAYSYSGTGAAGVTFFVAGPPVPSTDTWSLAFTTVSSVTQP